MKLHERKKTTPQSTGNKGQPPAPSTGIQRRTFLRNKIISSATIAEKTKRNTKANSGPILIESKYEIKGERTSALITTQMIAIIATE